MFENLLLKTTLILLTKTRNRKFRYILAPRTNFTQGGVCVFSLDKYDKEKMSPLEKSVIMDRQGFCGWFGLGGSVLQVSLK